MRAKMANEKSQALFRMLNGCIQAGFLPIQQRESKSKRLQIGSLACFKN
jgi:hypothetical protein